MSNFDSGLRTDACPSPPRDEKDDEKIQHPPMFGKTEEPEEIPRASPSPKHKTHRKAGFSRPKALNACAINISNSNGIQIGSNYTINNHIKSPKKEPEEIQKTEKILKLMSSTVPVQREHLQFVSIHVGEGWKDIGRHLNYSDGQIDQFYEDNFITGVKEVIYQLLKDWIQNEPDNATLGNLANALWKSEQKDCVQRLAKKIFN